MGALHRQHSHPILILDSKTCLVVLLQDLMLGTVTIACQKTCAVFHLILETTSYAHVLAANWEGAE
jgi:hypothetical protein